MNKLFKKISILMLSAVLSFSITARAEIDFTTNDNPSTNILIGDNVGDRIAGPSFDLGNRNVLIGNDIANGGADLGTNNILMGNAVANGSLNVSSSILMGLGSGDNSTDISNMVCLGTFTCVAANGVTNGINIGTGAGQTGTSTNTILIGTGTTATTGATENGTVVGTNAQINIGGEGTARNATALGANTVAGADGATAVGSGAIAINGTAIGSGSMADGGSFAGNGMATGIGSIAILGSSSANNAYAIGGTASANEGVAIGYTALNTGLNSVAIGSGSNDFGQQNVVSFGGALLPNGTLLTRRLINVSDGLVNATSTDAVNGSQLFDAVNQANSYTDNAIANLNLGGGTPVDLNPLLARDGTRAMTGNLNLGGNQINNLQDGISASDASTVGQMQLYANSLVYQDDGVTAGQMFVTPDTAALVVTNSLGNTHGLTVGTDRTVLSGGTQSTSITLDDTGLTLSNTTTGTARISGLSQGVLGTDAVNVDQLNAAIAGISGGGNPAEIRRLDGRVNDLEKQLRKVARKAYGGAALAMALQSATPPKPGVGEFGFGMGVFGGESAMGVSFTKASLSGNSVTSFGGGVTASGAFGFRGSVTFSWNPTSNEDKDADVEVKAVK